MTTLAEQLKKEKEITIEHKQFTIYIQESCEGGFDGSVYLKKDYLENEDEAEVLDGGLCESEDELTAIKFFLDIAIDEELKAERFENDSTTGSN